MNDICEYAGCTDPEATNYDPTAIIDDGSCRYTVFCWRCTNKIPYEPELDEFMKCPEGWELAPDPFWVWDGGPYDDMEGGINNPCLGPDKPDRDRPEPGPSNPVCCNDPEATNYDPDCTNPCDGDLQNACCQYETTAGPWFCPSDSGNFPWPGCCVQAGVDYSYILTQYPEAPDWLQTYFNNPVGDTYDSNEECNANSGCGEHMLPDGLQNCAGTYSPPTDWPVEPPQLQDPEIQDPEIDRMQKLAGIIKNDTIK